MKILKKIRMLFCNHEFNKCGEKCDGNKHHTMYCCSKCSRYIEIED